MSLFWLVLTVDGLVVPLTINHVVDVKYGLPVVAEDIEAHVAFEVDVWVIYLLSSSSTQAGLRKIRRTHTFVSQSTFGGWCGYCDGILNRNGYVPPFQNPSSGLSVMVKVNKSSFPFGKLIDVVGLRLSSCISTCRKKVGRREHAVRGTPRKFNHVPMVLGRGFACPRLAP